MPGQRRPRNRRRITVCLLTALLVVAGCGSSGGESIDGTDFDDDEADLPRVGGDPTDASALLIGTSAPITTVDPVGGGVIDLGQSGLVGDVLYNVTDRLVEAGPRTDEFRPGLATDWITSPDGRVHIFSLRKGVTFHDGRAFDADDVVWSLGRTLDNDEDIVVIEASGEHEVTITLADAEAELLSRLSRPGASIVPAGVDGDVIGTGPYEVVELHPQEFLTLRQFEGYWGDAPAIDTIRITIYDSPVHLRDALVNDEVDVAFDTLPPNAVATVADAGLKVARHRGVEAYYQRRIGGVEAAVLAGRPIWFPLLNLVAA